MAQLSAQPLRPGRAAAVAAGFKIFSSLIRCPIQRHGTVRRLSDSQCVACIVGAHDLMKQARTDGKEAALKQARAEVQREQRRATQEAERVAAEALKAARKVERERVRRAAVRALAKAKTLAAGVSAAGVPAEFVEALEVLPGLDSMGPPWPDESPPWD